MASSTAAGAASSLLRSSSMKWAVGGWTFFIAENLVLSENRTFLIDKVGDESYHAIYGTLSTIATASIGYAYLYKIPKNAPPLVWLTSSAGPPLSSRLAAWVFLSLGATMASQALPKLQIPVAYKEQSSGEIDDNSAVTTSGGDSAVIETTKPSHQVVKSGQWKVQCPFDFTDSNAASSSSDGRGPHANVVGLDLISRHPGLWSMGFMCLGQACLLPSIPQRVWWSMPLVVAWIGGWHTDSRYRRNMGGSLPMEYDVKTSNVPFVALIQNGGWRELQSQVKPLNAVLATSIATVYVLRRGRVPTSVVAAAR